MKTSIELNNRKDGLNLLEIKTDKGSRGKIESRAYVVQVENNDGMPIVRFRIFGDFSATIESAEGRATQKKLSEVHDKAMAKLPEIIERAKSFYADKGEVLEVDPIIVGDIRRRRAGR